MAISSPQFPSQPKLNWRAGLKRSWEFNAPLTLLGVLMVITLVGTLFGILLDNRIITGMPAWVKPAKFAISIALYSFTFVWLLTFVKGHRRLVAIAGNLTAIGFLIEMVIVIAQVLRGTTSHFNVGTPLDATLFSAMGGIIIIVWLMGFLAAVLIVFQKFANRVFAWSLRLGLFVSLIGMALAFLMTAQRPAGNPAGIAGAHSVGAIDGGPGLPFVGWSTVAGDLRIAHFVGIHAVQLLPIIGWLLLRPSLNWLGQTRRLVLIWTAGLGYLGLVGLLAWQALRGQSIVAPDGLTLLALAALVVIVGGIYAVTILTARKPGNSLAS